MSTGRKEIVTWKPVGLSLEAFDVETPRVNGYLRRRSSYERDKMISSKILRLSAKQNDSTTNMVFCADHLICFGWVGKDRASLQAHIDELVRLGVPAPGRVPIFMTFSNYLLTSADEITVTSDTTSGEAEYVLLCRDSQMWVTVGSDQTDRDIETKSLPASKQMCAKCVAQEAWPYEEVAGHWDSLMLRCWTEQGGRRILYQESPLSSILGPQELLEILRREDRIKPGGTVIFSGTIPTLAGLVCGTSYDLELDDPVLHRKITHRYEVNILPQFL
jgi:hypothetical protein